MQVYLRGNQGEALSNESVDAIRKIVADTPPPPGVKAYVTGAAPLITDNFEVGSAGHPQGHRDHLPGHRGDAARRLPLDRHHAPDACDGRAVELAAARGVVAALANSGVIGLSTYSTNLLTLLAIAAGTDYAIFVVGRYQEARSRRRGARSTRTTTCSAAPSTSSSARG